MRDDPLTNLDYATPRRAAAAERWSLSKATVRLSIALFALACYTNSELLTVPSGSLIMPMGTTLMLVLEVFVGLLILMPMAVTSLVLAWRRREPYRWPMWAMVSSVLATLSGPVYFFTVIYVKNLTLD